MIQSLLLVTVCLSSFHKNAAVATASLLLDSLLVCLTMFRSVMTVVRNLPSMKNDADRKGPWQVALALPYHTVHSRNGDYHSRHYAYTRHSVFAAVQLDSPCARSEYS